MLRAFKFLIVIALLAFASAWLADHPGRVSLTWENWRVDTSVGLMVSIVAVMAIAAALIYRFWLSLRRAPASIKNALHERRRRRGYEALTRGMVAVAAGDAPEASKQVKRADVLLGDPALTLLLSAQAAQLTGDETAATRFFEAMRERPETEFLGLRGLLNQALKQGDGAAALGLAHQAHRLNPKSRWVGSTLLGLEVRQGQWQDAALTLKSAVKNKAVDPVRGRRQGGVLALQLSFEAERDGDAAAALKQARRAVDLAPTLVPAAVRLARLQAGAGKAKQAEATLEAAWGRSPHSDLVAAYLDSARSAGSIDPIENVKAVQRLIGKDAEHQESRLALAEVALAAELWGEARKQLELLVETGAPARVCRMMAQLEEREGGDAAAAHDWLMRASMAPPDPTWVCNDCHATARRWTACCEHCSSFDSLRWEVTGGEPLAAIGSASELPSTAARLASPQAPL